MLINDLLGGILNLVVWISTNLQIMVIKMTS